MRICRFEYRDRTQVGFYDETAIVPIAMAAAAYQAATQEKLSLPTDDNLLHYLPPAGTAAAATHRLAEWVKTAGGDLPSEARLAPGDVQLLVPIPRPNKLFLLAGNYAAHIEEGGGMAAEQAETFPYVFMKPASTTLTHPGQPIVIPKVSPDAIDWELELAVVIGRRIKGISAAEALSAVAGYTVINDISDRRFKPNPQRKQRDKDGFFDWLHGKWHDSFCPCGPCITSADAISDPQTLPMQLRVSGKTHQDASTALQIFPVAAVIEFIASFVTLEPGDIISTGTPAGVGNTTGTFLKPGDRLEASISQIGTLVTPVVGEE